MHDRLVSRRTDSLHQCFLVILYFDVSKATFVDFICSNFISMVK